MIQTRSYRLVLPLLLGLGAGCDDSRDRAPLGPAEQPGFSSAASVVLLECPIDQEVTESATIDSLGGALAVTDSFGGRHEVVFPAGAVAEPTVFTLTAPASMNVLVRVTATDPVTAEEKEVSFPIEAEPSLAVSYKRCPPSELERPDLQLYQVDELTGEPINGAFGGEELPAIPTFGARQSIPSDLRVRGRVPHFSEYAVGSPEDAAEEPIVP